MALKPLTIGLADQRYNAYSGSFAPSWQSGTNATSIPPTICTFGTATWHNVVLRHGDIRAMPNWPGASYN